jgi:hypothetical protein
MAISAWTQEDLISDSDGPYGNPVGQSIVMFVVKLTVFEKNLIGKVI